MQRAGRPGVAPAVGDPGCAHDPKQALADLERAVRQGPGAVLTGDAGSGKSHAVRALAARLRSRGMTVELVLATEAARSVPLGAMVGLLDPAAVAAGDLLEILRSTGARLKRAGGRAGVLVIIDDAHRLDPASAALVLGLVTRDRIRVVATVRSHLAAPDAVTALSKDAGLARIELAPLSEPATAELARGVLGAPLERSTRRWLWQTSAGNALFTRELLRSATANGELIHEHGHWRLAGSFGAKRLPGLLEEQIDALGADERRALALVVLAEPLTLQSLERLGALDAARTLEARGLLAAVQDSAGAEAALRTGHPLYGEALRATLPATEARALHEALCAELDPDDETMRLRAAVWALEDGRPVDGATLAQASELALKAFDAELAIRCGEAATRAGGGAAAALALAAALRTVGRLADAEAQLAVIEDHLDSGRQTAYLFARAMNLQALGRGAQADAIVQRAGAGPGPAAVTAALQSQRGRLHDAVGHARRALAAPTLDRRATAIAAVALGHDLALLGKPATALAALDRAADAAGGVESEWPLAAIAMFGAFYGATDWPARTAALNRRHTAASAAGDQGRAALCELTLASMAIPAGDLAGARRHGEDALTRLSFMDPRGLAPIAHAVIAEAAACAGEADRARVAFDRGLGLLTDGPPNPLATGLVESVRPFVLAVGGDERGAQRAALTAAAAGGEAVLAEAEMLHNYVRVGGDPGRVAARLTEIADQAEAKMVDLWARQAGAAGDRDGAALETVSTAFERVGARLYAAEAAAQAAAAYAAGSSDARRRTQARAARLAAGCGAHGLVLVGAHRVAGLTVREREIARHVANGLSNPQIAARLSLSVRTVESHIYRASTKLGVHDRAELCALLELRRRPGRGLQRASQ